MTTDATTCWRLPLRAAVMLAPAGLAAMMLAPAAATAAAIFDADPFNGQVPVPYGELRDLRGGMTIGGLSVDFAVVVSTTAQAAGQAPIGLQTTLAINNAGGLGAVSTAPIGAAAQVAAAATAGGGVSVTLANNATQIVQQVTRDQVLTLIGNAANGMTITQHTDMNVTLPGFLTLNRQYNVRNQVANQVMSAAVFGLGGH